MEIPEVIRGFLLIFALTTDSFVVSFAYGMSGTAMAWGTVAGMNLIMSSLLGAALWAGNAAAGFVPSWAASWLGTGFLFVIGVYRLCAFFRKKEEKEQEKTRALTGGTAVLLAFALSADSLAAGLGTGLVQSGEMLLAVGSFFGGILMMKAGWILGFQGRQAAGRDLSWLGGVCLLALAFSSLWL